LIVDTDISDWIVGDEIALAASSFEQREHEYFSITSITGQTLGLNSTVKHLHTGSENSKIIRGGAEYDQGAEISLLTRNILIDGTGGSERKIGGRIIIATLNSTISGNTYLREGYGQFSNVQFKGMGQFGYTNYDDFR
jgi:hypothetical protein